MMYTKGQVFSGLLTMVLIFAFYYVLVGRSLPFPWPFVLILCGLGTLFTLGGIGSFRVGLQELRQARRMQHSTQSRPGRSFRDGELVAVLGRIHPVDGQPISSPFSKQACVYYSYDIFRWVDRERLTDYSGLRLVPCVVQSPSAAVRIFAMPAFEGFEPRTSTYSDSTRHLFEEAYRYTQSTSFDQIRLRLSGIGGIYALVRDLITDDDGAVRKDLQYSEDAAEFAYAFPSELDMRLRTLEESWVPVGEEVALTGTWSAVKGGIISDPRRSLVVLTRGSPEQAIGRTRRQGWMKIAEGAVAFASINLIIGVFWVILHGGPRIGIVNGRTIEQETLPSTSELAAPTVFPVSLETPTVALAWVTYVNPVGKYSHELPADWTVTEMVNDDLNTPGTDVLSVWSQVSRPGTNPTEVVLSVGYRYGDATCHLDLVPPEDWALSEISVAGRPAQVGWQFNALGGSGSKRFQELILLAVGERCYRIEILDREDRSNAAVFDRILASLAFLD